MFEMATTEFLQLNDLSVASHFCVGAVKMESHVFVFDGVATDILLKGWQAIQSNAVKLRLGNSLFSMALCLKCEKWHGRAFLFPKFSMFLFWIKKKELSWVGHWIQSKHSSCLSTAFATTKYINLVMHWPFPIKQAHEKHVWLTSRSVFPSVISISVSSTPLKSKLLLSYNTTTLCLLFS